MNRVSMVSVGEVLDRYLDADLFYRIMEDIEKASHEEEKAACGMLYGEWKNRFDDPHSVVWAADSGAGFGKKGWTVYGDCDDMRIVQIDTHQNGEKTLHLWYNSRNDWKEGNANGKDR